jgi:hypothetical protein
MRMYHVCVWNRPSDLRPAEQHALPALPALPVVLPTRLQAAGDLLDKLLFGEASAFGVSDISSASPAAAVMQYLLSGPQ